MYTYCASAAVSLVDASGVVTSAIMACPTPSSSVLHDGRRAACHTGPNDGVPYTPMRESTDRRRETHMAKLIQICASENDLFGLDADGRVYHYNFKTNNWVKLGRGQRDHEGSRRGEGQLRSAQPDVVQGGGRPDGEAVAGRPT